MSKYTTEVRYICETYAGLTESADMPRVDEIIELARSKIFDFDYPIFDEEYRQVLEHKILRHFYTREIGQETVGLWKLELDKKMNDIMPYYNQLYLSTQIEFNPLTDVSYERSGSESLSTSESTQSSLSTSESSSDSNSAQQYDSMLPNSFEWNLEQDTPQNQLEGVADLEYLTRATKIQRGGDDQEYHRNQTTGVSASQGLSAGNTTKDVLDTKGYLERYLGYRNSNPSKLLSDYRDTFLNIDLIIIGELEKLFLYLW